MYSTSAMDLGFRSLPRKSDFGSDFGSVGTRSARVRGASPNPRMPPLLTPPPSAKFFPVTDAS